jgi:hypothetical protein
MALHRRTTPVRPIEKMSVVAYVIAVAAMGGVLLTGGSSSSEKALWLVGILALAVGSVCLGISSWGKLRDR